jgi:hypothetical protein
MGTRSSGAATASAAIVAIIGFLILYVIAIGGLLAYLWNNIVVNSLHVTTNTLDLWQGVGLFILLNIIGGAFRSYTSSK